LHTVAGGLAALLDDIAAFAKLAAASIDDVGAAAGRASTKAAGVVIDDTAVTPRYVHGFAASRELPIIKRIATGSLRNKLLFILPAALVLSEFVPTLVEVILMIGGTYLCYEGAEKIWEKVAHHPEPTAEVPAALVGPEQEKAMVTGAIRTDLILSGEIMVIALKEVIDEPFVARGLILVVVALLVTAMVYGIVALIVKMDDFGLRLAESPSASRRRIGTVLVGAMPKVLTWLSIIGTVALVWVGGHILLVGADELGWHWPYEQVHHAEEEVHDLAGIGGVLAWIVNTGISAVVGLAVGALAVIALHVLPSRRHEAEAAH
jgi:predicted DNA repair protein MutK